MIPEKMIMQNIHKLYPYDDLLEWRKLANTALKVEEDARKKTETVEQSAARFFSGLFGQKPAVSRSHLHLFII
jgi:hypothetical protein